MDAALVDPLLPAAPHLTGPDAVDVVGPAVESAGGRVQSLTPTQVLYRHGRELVVRYTAMVRWGDGPACPETLFAATTVNGEPPGTLPVEADGMRVGVWRFPFDPGLPGLSIATTHAGAAALLGRSADEVRVELRSFRPLRRAVSRAAWPGGQAYLKVVPPSDVSGLLRRHSALLAAGLPVPRVIAADEARGVVALAALDGSNLRRALIDGTERLPDAVTLLEVVEAFGGIETSWAAGGGSERPSLVRAARRHATMISTVLPSECRRVRRLTSDLAERERGLVAPELAVVHGDLHDGQLQVHEGRVVGLLDVDDVGVGDPLDDVARFVAHTVALTVLTPARTAELAPQVSLLWRGLADTVLVREIGVRVAAALVGLATGPFRSQSAAWRDEVPLVLGVAERVLADERSLSRPSWASHAGCVQRPMTDR